MTEIGVELFLDEADELLADLEAALLELETAPGDRQLVSRIFRALHTIKGSGAMYGFTVVADFAHRLEAVYDRVRSGEIPVTPVLIAATLAAKDHIRALLDGSADPGEEPEACGFFSVDTTGPAKEDVAPEPSSPELQSYRIRFSPPAEMMKYGGNPLLLLNELRELGDCCVDFRTGRIPPLETIDPDHLYLDWEILLETAADIAAIRDVFIFADDGNSVAIDLLQTEAEEFLPAVVENRETVGSGPSVSAKNATAASSIRVAADKLDRLVDLVGELVTVQARLTQAVSGKGDPLLSGIAEEVERLAADLRQNSLDIRMLPIGSTFGRFRRLVRDLSAETGKDVVLVAEGGETELDKTVIEKLGDPFVHLIRNCVDHGIESPKDRRASGKSPVGTIRLSAQHSGDAVVVRIGDDGRGLDRQAILAKAVEQGVVAHGAEVPDRLLFPTIFRAGFSTAERVTDLSGRGVGMDVVKQAVDAMRGTIEVESAPGAGTTFTIRLPLTLAIIETLLVRVGDQRLAIPLPYVDECIEIEGQAVSSAAGMNLVRVRGSLVPYLDLREKFGIGGERPELQQVVIGSHGGMQVGFVVDSVIGSHQSVIKSLGRMYAGVSGVSGATILGDGSVALILGVENLVAEEIETFAGEAA